AESGQNGQGRTVGSRESRIGATGDIERASGQEGRVLADVTDGGGESVFWDVVGSARGVSGGSQADGGSASCWWIMRTVVCSDDGDECRGDCDENWGAHLCQGWMDV